MGGVPSLGLYFFLVFSFLFSPPFLLMLVSVRVGSHHVSNRDFPLLEEEYNVFSGHAVQSLRKKKRLR